MFLYDVIIQPIECIIDWIFCFTQRRLSVVGIGGGILIVSLLINSFCLPVYNLADGLQKKERDTAKRLAPHVKRIKKAFKGDERFMMLSAYYKMSGYKPIYALRSSLPILLEIPFFLAAYHYLHNCEYLENVRFWMIPNLSKPDALLFGINVLPIIMTGINIISGLVYAKNSSLKENMTLIVMALVFLFLLYDSPSGLVLYWIFNNIFSLCKNIVSKTGHGKIVLYFLSVIFFAGCSFYLYNENIRYSIKIIVILFTLLVVLLPMEVKFLKKIISRFAVCFTFIPTTKQTVSILLLSGFALAITAGFVLPAVIVASSPSEFSFLGRVDNPCYYVFRNFCVFVGFFVFWPSVICYTLPQQKKFFFACILSVFCICSVFNVFVFNHDYGIINSNFNLEDVGVLRSVSLFLSIMPFIVLILSCCFVLFVSLKCSSSIIGYLFLSLCIGSAIFGGMQTSVIQKGFLSYKELYVAKDNVVVKEVGEGLTPIFNLSKKEKNVVVVFLDRAVSSFFPYVLQEIPELRQKFEGFVYYPNSLSFSRNTDNASPAMLAGYEYIPKKLNARSDMTVCEKQNEANVVLPTMFLNNGFAVSIINPPLSNYQEHGDLSPFKAFPEINACETYGNYIDIYKTEKHITDSSQLKADDLCKKGMVDYCFMRLMNPLLRFSFYENCRWAIPNTDLFYDIFSGLYYLDKITGFKLMLH